MNGDRSSSWSGPSPRFDNLEAGDANRRLDLAAV
jgi:hypothetical protein